VAHALSARQAVASPTSNLRAIVAADTGHPYLDGENVPAVAAPSKDFVANEKYCVPGAARRTGNLPFNVNSGIHSADDVVLTASGPGADMFHGRIDNTRVFRIMATALGLGAK
jgi:alkaline phosphatase